MRLVLFIPVLVLFLSNVPFVQEIPLEKAIAMMQEDETCGKQKECSRNNENNVASCSQEKQGCDESIDTTEEEPAKNNCSQKRETTCICIFCFQFAAPIQLMTSFKFSCSKMDRLPFTYIDMPTKDPYIGAPWQPPDFV